MYKYLIFIFALITLTSCGKNKYQSDAYGNFEATTITVSSETTGKLLFFDIDEGQKVKTGEIIAIVDTTQLNLQRKQLQSSIGSLTKKLRNVDADVNVLRNQKSNLLRERDRIKRLVAKKAATTKQLDDLNGQIDVVDKQIIALQSQTKINNNSILSEKEPLLAQINIVNDHIKKSYITNPLDGTVLTKLAEAHEIVRMGSPLYRIGQLDEMTLRFYVDAIQLQGLKISQNIKVLIDKDKDDFFELTGRISWISDQAEFTPKTIQTKKDRVNLVYAINAQVPNKEGLIKIGMPAEVVLTNDANN